MKNVKKNMKNKMKTTYIEEVLFRRRHMRINIKIRKMRNARRTGATRSNDKSDKSNTNNNNNNNIQ